MVHLIHGNKILKVRAVAEYKLLTSVETAAAVRVVVIVARLLTQVVRYLHGLPVHSCKSRVKEVVSSVNDLTPLRNSKF